MIVKKTEPPGGRAREIGYCARFPVPDDDPVPLQPLNADEQVQVGEVRKGVTVSVTLIPTAELNEGPLFVTVMLYVTKVAPATTIEGTGPIAIERSSTVTGVIAADAKADPDNI